MEELGPMIGAIGMFVAIGYIVRWVSDNRRQVRMAQMHFDLHNKLLDKFGSSQDLVEYLHSDAGSKYLTWMPAERAKPYARILSSVQWGIVLLTGGAAFLFLRTQIAEAFESFTVLGAFGVALGIGFLLSAVVAFVLSKSWGVINGQQSSLPDQV